MKIKARPFIDHAIEESEVVPFMLREITKHRREELIMYINLI